MTGQPRIRRSLSGKVLPPGHKTAPSWHELVQPGPKGDPAKKWKRINARRRGTYSVHPSSIAALSAPRAQRADERKRRSVFVRAVNRLRGNTRRSG